METNQSPILQFLQRDSGSRSPLTMSEVRKMYDKVRSAPNPGAVMQQLAANNPQLRQALEEAGNNPREAFFRKAQKLGINAEEFLSQFR